MAYPARPGFNPPNCTPPDAKRGLKFPLQPFLLLPLSSHLRSIPSSGEIIAGGGDLSPKLRARHSTLRTTYYSATLITASEREHSLSLSLSLSSIVNLPSAPLSAVAADGFTLKNLRAALSISPVSVSVGTRRGKEYKRERDKGWWAAVCEAVFTENKQCFIIIKGSS